MLHKKKGNMYAHKNFGLEAVYVGCVAIMKLNQTRLIVCVGIDNLESKNMVKIDGKYKQDYTERLLRQINGEDSITKRHHLISRYLYQREKQVEKVIANIEDDDIDLSMVIEQLWEDLQLAHKQIQFTINRSDFYADYHKLDKWDGKFNG